MINGVVNYGEVVQNMLAFAPFGLYMGMLAPHRSFWLKLVPIAATSLALELLQFVFAAGATDITDFLANTAGGMLGLALYAIMRRIVRSDGRALRVCNGIALGATVLIVGLLGLLVLANG